MKRGLNFNKKSKFTLSIIAIFLVLIVIQLTSALEYKVDSSGKVTSIGEQTDPLLEYLLSDTTDLTPEEIKVINTEIESFNEELKTGVSKISSYTNHNQVKSGLRIVISSHRASSDKAAYYSELLSQKGLDNLAKYAKQNQREFTIKIPSAETLKGTAEKNKITIEENGKEFLVITEPYSIKESPDGKLKIVNSDPYNRGNIYPVKLRGNEIVLVQGKTLEISHVNDMVVLNSDYIDSFKQNGGRELRKIEQAALRLDENGEITYVKFTSKEGDRYPIKNNGKIYTVVVNKGGKVEIDFTKGTLELENINDFSIDGKTTNKFWLGEDPESYLKKGLKSNGKVSLTLNKNGDISSATFENIVFSIEAGNFYSINGPMTVIFGDKTKYDQLKSEGIKNLVFIDDSQVLLNGKVNADDFNSNSLFYRGQEDDTYVEFDRKDNFFDVKKGDVTFGDDSYKISIKNNEAFFHKSKESVKEHEFGFSHINNKGLKEEGFIKTSFSGDDLTLNLFNKENQKVLSFSLDTNLLTKSASVPDLIVSNQIKNVLKGQIKFSEARLKTLEAEGKKGSKEWYETKFNILNAQANLNPFEGKKATDTLSEVKSLITEIESKADNQEYKEVLGKFYDQAGKLITQKVLDSKDSMIGTITVTQRGGFSSNPNLENLQPDISNTYQLKLGSNGEVRAYSDDQGKTWKPIDSQLPYDLKFLKKDSSVSALKSIQKSSSSEISYSVLIPENYNENVKLAQEAREDFKKAESTGIYQPGELESKQISTMISLGDNIEAERLAQRIIDLNSRGENINDAYVKEAYVQKARALFLDGKFAESKKTLDKSLSLYSDDVGIKKVYKDFTTTQLSTISNLANQEDERVFQNLGALTTDLGARSRSQGFFDSLAAIASPYTTGYKVTNFDSYLTDAESQIARAGKIGLGSKHMQQLVDNGINLNEYYESNYFDRFLGIYSSAGLDDLVPTNDLSDIFNNDKLRNTNPSQRQEIILSLLGEKGYSRDNPELQRRFDDTVRIMGLIDYATSKEHGDPTLRSFMTGGDFVEIGDRLGKEIKLNTAEYASLFAADIFLNPLNLVGAGFGARGASATTEGLSLGLTTGLKTTAKAWSGITARELASAYLKEVIVDAGVSYSLEGLANVDPELAKTIGLGMGLLVAGGFTKGVLDSLGSNKLGVKVFGDLTSTNKFFVRTQKDLDTLASKFDGKIGEDGIFKYNLDGNEIKVSINPQSTNELFEVSALDIALTHSQANLGQKILNDVIEEQSAKTSDELTSTARERLQADEQKFFDAGKNYPTDDQSAARGFIDSDHYFLYRDMMVGPDGYVIPIELRGQPELAYGIDDWMEWKRAHDYIEEVTKTNDGKISVDLIKEIGRRIPSKTLKGRLVNRQLDLVPLEQTQFRITDTIPGAEFQLGPLLIYDQENFLRYAANPYLDVSGKKLTDSPEMIDYLISRIYSDPELRTNADYIKSINYIKENPDKYYTGVVSYPTANKVPEMMDNLVEKYNPFIENAKTVREITNVAADLQREYVSIHPFEDGNGRTSRLLMDYVLRSKGLPPAHLKNPNLDITATPEKWREEVYQGVLNAIMNMENGRIVY
ncbi:MAG: Fic family protein [archaeon]